MTQLCNLAKVSTPTTGTGIVALGPAATGFLTFEQAGLKDGDYLVYTIVDGSNIEIGRGIYNIAGPTLTRTGVIQSNNNNNPIDLSGAAEVFVTDVAGTTQGSVATSEIYASWGKIGGWSLTAETLTSDDGMVALKSSIYPYIGLGGADAYGESGIWFGKDSLDDVYKFFVGDNAGQYMAWDGSGLVVNAEIYALSGNIAGWDISPTQIAKGGIILDSPNELIRVGSVAPYIDIDGANKRIRSSDYVSGLAGFQIDAVAGNAEFNNVLVRGELRSTVFVKGLIEARAGTSLWGKSAGDLASDMVVPGSGTWMMTVKDPPGGGFLFSNSDICYIKSEYSGGIAAIWFTVSSRVDNANGTQSYTCTYNSGTRSITYPKSAPISDWGISGQGLISISADGSIGGIANISIFTHSGSPWTTTTLQARMGNLNGSYGTVTDVYGFGIGDYSGQYLLWNGSVLTVKGAINIQSGSAGIANLSDAGALATVNNLDGVPDGSSYKRTTTNEKTGAGRAYSALNASNVLVTKVIPGTNATPSGAGLYLGADYMGYYSGSAWKTYIANNGDLYLAGSAANNYIQWDASANKLQGVGGGVEQWYADATDGKIKAGAGAVVLGSTGILIQSSSIGGESEKQIKFYDGSFASVISYIENYQAAATSNQFRIITNNFSSRPTDAVISATGDVILGSGSSGAVYLNNLSIDANSHIISSSAVRSRVYRNSNQSISNTTETAISFSTARTNSNAGGSYIWDSGTPTRLTCRVAGTYYIFGNVSFDANGTGVRQARIRLGGSTELAIENMSNLDASVTPLINLSCFYDLTVGQYVELTVYQSSGGNLDVIYGSAYSPEFGMARIA